MLLGARGWKVKEGERIIQYSQALSLSLTLFTLIPVLPIAALGEDLSSARTQPKHTERRPWSPGFSYTSCSSMGLWCFCLCWEASRTRLFVGGMTREEGALPKPGVSGVSDSGTTFPGSQPSLKQRHPRKISVGCSQFGAPPCSPLELWQQSWVYRKGT